MEHLPIDQQSHDHQMVLLHIPKTKSSGLKVIISFSGHNIFYDVQTLFDYFL